MWHCNSCYLCSQSSMALSFAHNLTFHLHGNKIPFAFQSQIKPSSKPNINRLQLLQFPSTRCSSSSHHQTSSVNLRTCKNCKTQFDPSLNHPLACRFHTAHYGGETKRKFESVYEGGTMNTPGSGKVLQYWHCCGSEDPFDLGCTASPHSSRLLQTITTLRSNNVDVIFFHFTFEMDDQIESCSSNTLVQCRICHDEDEDLNMDTPCSCSGTLKYAHRICVQRWCNEKGDTTCEICQQQLKGYTAPPQAPLFHYRGNWEIPRIGLNNHQFLALFPSNHEFLDFDFEYSAPSTRSRLFIRIVAIIFIVLLVLRHTLPIIFILNEVEESSLTVLTLLMWGITGVIVPAYIMVKAIQQLQNQDHNPLMQLQLHDERNMRQSQLRVIHIQ